MINKEQTIKRVTAKLVADKLARDKMLQKSFHNADSFEAKNRTVLMQKFVRVIRESEARLQKLRS